MLRTWLATRRLHAAERRFREGYNYAAGALLRGTPAIAIEATIAANAFDSDEFEQGMRRALCDHQMVTRGEPVDVVFNAHEGLPGMQPFWCHEGLLPDSGLFRRHGVWPLPRKDKS